MVRQALVAREQSNAGLVRIILQRVITEASKKAAWACGLLAAYQPVQAQSGPSYNLDFFRPQTLISPTIPEGFDRGGNLGLDQQSHPGYDATAIHIGNFSLYPSLDTFVGSTSNATLSRSNPKADTLVGTGVTLFATADFGTSNFTLYAKDWENVWLNTPERSQDQGSIDASYQFDVSGTVRAAVEGSFFRYGDNNDIGTVNNLSSILEITQRTFMGARVQYEEGRFSEIFSIDRNHYNLDPVDSPQTGLEQNYYFDHSVIRATSQTEYAFSPSVAAFGQISVYKTGYRFPLENGQPNYGSFSYRLLSGLSLDVPGVLSGQISAGIGHRDYDSPLYKTPTGLVIASRLNLYPDEKDNVSLVLQKDFDDGAINSLSPIRYTMLALVYERQLRKNIYSGFRVMGFTQNTPSQTANTSQNFSNYGGSFFVKYYANPHMFFRFDVGAARDVNNTPSASIPDYEPNTEIRTKLSVSFMP